jgi:hypothetical protein
MRSNSNLNAKGSISDNPCLVTVDTRTAIMIARPDTTVALPERELIWPNTVQMA